MKYKSQINLLFTLVATLATASINSSKAQAEESFLDHSFSSSQTVFYGGLDLRQLNFRSLPATIDNTDNLVARIAPNFILSAAKLWEIRGDDPSLTTASIASGTAASQTAGKTKAYRRDVLFGARKIRFGKIPAARRLAPVFKDLAAASEGKQLAPQDIRTVASQVNERVNRLITYRSDAEIHGAQDVWQMPGETLKRGTGDCEDFAILKLFMLARAGVPRDAMDIVILKDTRRKLYHAVLVVRNGAGNLVLDNLHDTVRSDTELKDYAPLFSLSKGGNSIFGYEKSSTVKVADTGNPFAATPGAGF
jgi:predicted transglutaminase-like cysteine proteinase